MKKIIKILLLLTITINTFSFNIINALADTYIATITDPEGVNVRSGPGTDHQKIGVLSYKASITLNNNIKHSGKNCSGGWYQLTYNGKIGYICSDLVSVKTDSTVDNKGNYYTTTSWSARISENYATVRNAPYGSKIEIIYLGTDVTIEQKTTNTTNCSKGWYKITYYGNKSGYVCGNFVDEYQNVTTTDTEYYKVLKNAGFPESYWPMLTSLHKKYPNWVFKAEKTNKDFNEAINNETGKNYIQTNVDNYRLSNTVVENPNWYRASSPVVAFYLDPRNYLNEKNIFVFENLGYDKNNHTKEVVKSIFNSSYLSSDEYIGYFMEAANNYNISPVHLATRVKQEGGSNESYDAVSGNSSLTYGGKSLKGFYNYYNIGAYQDNVTSRAVARGLAVAAGYVDSYYGVPWKTRKDAIIYGARFIANAYINKGQNTMYYQKFNTGPNNVYTSYTNQYMTNIIAPASESLSTYTSYSELSLLNTPYVFTIPVYNNMPEAYTMHPPIGNTNNDLAEIKINNTFLPGFDSDVLTYEYFIPSDTTKLSISAKAKVSTSTLSYNKEITIKDEETKVNIVVTSQTGSNKTYTINIIKTKQTSEDKLTPDQIIEKIPVKISGEYITGISIDTLPSTIISEVLKADATAKAKITSRNDDEKNTKLATGDKLVITSNNITKTYVIAIKGDINGDGSINSIDLLRVQKHILKYTTLTNEYKVAADVSYDDKIDSLDLLKIQKHILGYTRIK